MIHDHTVFVLGAGASRPYLFPTAGELREMILQRNEPIEILENMGFENAPPGFGVDARTKFRNWLYAQLLRYRVKRPDVEEFQMRFRKSELYSIDSFIAKNPDYQKLGSLLIAIILLKCEQENVLSGDWYQMLFNELVYDGIAFPEGMLSIVTFNYDRSLEVFLFNSFQYAYNLGVEDAWSIMQRIKIVHVYGDLGDLPYSGSATFTRYGDISGAGQAVDRIKLVNPRAESNNVGEMAAIFQAAKRTIFLGFGFDPMNLKALGIKTPEDQCLASCYGLSASIKRRAEIALKPRISIYPQVIWGNETFTVAKFLHSIDAFA